jgi:hypothetical protein
MRKIITPALQADWLRRSGISTGNGLIESKNPPTTDSAGLLATRQPEVTLAPVCVERERVTLTKKDVEQAIRSSLPGPDIKLIVERFSQNPLPGGRAVFPLVGARRPSPIHPDAPFLWQGRWVAIGHDANSDPVAGIPIWASVRAYRVSRQVRLRTSAPAGSQLREEQLEMAVAIRSALEEDPNLPPEHYVGRVLKRFCSIGTPLNDQLTETVPVIRKDAVVPVEIVSGDLRLKLRARAETDGWSGQTIPFLIPAGHRRFRAQVQSSGTAVLGMSSNEGLNVDESPRK